MRISDCSSDVCSSDLVLKAHGVGQRSIVDALDNPRNDAAQLRADDAVVEAAGARVKHRDDALAGEESRGVEAVGKEGAPGRFQKISHFDPPARSEEHTSELQSLMRISYAVFCLKKK